MPKGGRVCGRFPEQRWPGYLDSKACYWRTNTFLYCTFFMTLLGVRSFIKVCHTEQLCVVAALVNEQSWWRHVAEQSCIGRKCICWNRDWEHGSRIPSKGDNESRSPLGILRRLRDRAGLTMLCRMERAISVGMLSATRWRLRNKLAQPEGLIFLTLQEESVHSLMSEP